MYVVVGMFCLRRRMSINERDREKGSMSLWDISSGKNEMIQREKGYPR